MIGNAAQGSNIKYICGNEQSLSQFEDHKFDLVTFAGALSYSKNEVLRGELNRICMPGARIVIYDFNVLINDLLKSANLNLSSMDFSDYDHSINISDWTEFEEEVVKKEQITFELSHEELSHFILSHSIWHRELVNNFNLKDPHEYLLDYFLSIDKKIRLNAKIFYSQYKVS